MNILQINSSSNSASATSTNFSNQLIEKLKSLHPNTEVKTRHTTYSDLPYVDATMLGGFFSQDRTPEQVEALKLSDALVAELQWADTIVIGSPIYNFSVPASLKAYFDLVARAGLTFKYTEQGPIGLLENKKAYIVMSSGGTAIGSDIDFAGKYTKHFLAFLGVTDIELIALDQLMMGAEAKQDAAKAQITAITA